MSQSYSPIATNAGWRCRVEYVGAAAEGSSRRKLTDRARKFRCIQGNESIFITDYFFYHHYFFIIKSPTRSQVGTLICTGMRTRTGPIRRPRLVGPAGPAQPARLQIDRDDPGPWARLAGSERTSAPVPRPAFRAVGERPSTGGPLPKRPMHAWAAEIPGPRPAPRSAARTAARSSIECERTGPGTGGRGRRATTSTASITRMMMMITTTTTTIRF